MKKIFLILIGTAFLASCGTETTSTINTEETTVVNEYFGDTISADNAVSMDEVVAMLESNDSAIVTLKSTVNAVCKKKGCWMTMPIDESVNMRVKFKDYGFFVPLNCEDKNAIVKGIARKEVITVETLKHYAEDAGDSQKDIDAITESEVEYSFLADGVILN